MGGNDTLIGGDGNDMFVFDATALSGNNVITDFEAGADPTLADRLQFSGIDYAGLTIENVGYGAMVSWANGSVLIEDTTTSDLTADQFLFV